MQRAGLNARGARSGWDYWLGSSKARTPKSTNDFSADSSVEVRDPGGMVVRFSLAFAVIRPATKQAAVFTEHSGYVEFDLVEDSVVAEIHENAYRQR